MQCRNCRSELAATARFCPTCGVTTAAAPAPTEPVATAADSTVASGRSGTRSFLPVVMTVAVVVALVVGGFVVVSSGGDDDPRSGGSAGGTTPSQTPVDTPTPTAPSTSSASTTSSPASPTTDTTTTTTSTIAPTTTAEPVPLDPNAAALDALATIIDSDRPTVDGHLDRWVPQISAKRDGLRWEGVDYGLPEILELHRRLDDRYGALLVSGSDYVFRIDDAPMNGWFITIVDESYPTPDGALEWCRINSIDRNNCAAKLITEDQLVDATLVLQ